MNRHITTWRADGLGPREKLQRFQGTLALQISSARMSRPLILFIFFALHAAYAGTIEHVELLEGTTGILTVPGIEKVVVEDAGIVEAGTSGSSEQFLIKTIRFGKSKIWCRDAANRESTFSVCVIPRFWNTLLALLESFPSVSPQLSGDYVVLSGFVPNKTDLLAVERATILSDRILNTVKVRTTDLDQRIDTVLQQHGLQGIEVANIGHTVTLRGEVFDAEVYKGVVDAVTSLADPYGVKVNLDGLYLNKNNLIVTVEFIDISKTKARDLGVKLENFVLDSGVIQADFTEASGGTSGMWSAAVTSSFRAQLNTLMQEGAASTAFTADMAAKNGNQCAFHNGGTIYLPVQGPQFSDVQEIDYGFKVVTVPAVLNRSLLDVQINLELSIPVAGTSGDAPLNLSKYSTASNYTVSPGDSIILSGLNRVFEKVAKQHVPILGEIPALGVLFQNWQKNKDAQEALVIVTVDWKNRRGARVEARRDALKKSLGKRGDRNE